MIKKPKVSIIVILYNNSKFIPDLLSSLQIQTYKDFEVLFIDNNSIDDTERIVNQVKEKISFLNKITYKRLDSNTGFSYANNLGANIAEGEYILFMNSDVTLDEKAMHNMVFEIEKKHKDGLCIGVAPKMYFTKFLPKKVFDSVGICVSYECSPFNRGIGQFDFGQYDKVDRIFGCCFGCALINKEIFLKLGGLDEDYFAYFEDVDFCIRARKSGFEFYSCPSAIAYHHHSASSSNNSYTWKYKLIFSNYLKTVTKSLGKKSAIKIIIKKLKDLITEAVKNKDLLIRKTIIEIIISYTISDLWKNLKKRKDAQLYFKNYITDKHIFWYSIGEPSNFFDPVNYTLVNINDQKEFLEKRMTLTQSNKNVLKSYYSKKRF